MAPEGDRLTDSGLPADVVETILIARMCRKMYALKWSEFFLRWCAIHHANLVHCQIVSMLEFLQEKLSAGICPTTFRVFVAAIADCHALIGGVSVGIHPLIPHFIHGARLLRPPVREKVLLWDIAVVLEGLINNPFEPLRSVPVKHLTLKIVFLMLSHHLREIGI